jgi:hypothetical protein
LQNGVTYKAYVKSAQSFHSQPWYTDWASSSAFTVSLGPPADPTMTVTADDTYQRALVTVAANQNVLGAQDSDFEDSAGATGDFTVLVNCAAVRSTTKSVAPSVASMRLTATAGADMTATKATNTPVVGGRQYTFYAQFAANAATRTCRVEVDWLDAAGTIIGATVNGSGVTDSAANFNATSTLTANAPSGARTVKVRVRVLVPLAAEIHYVDHVGMWPGPSVAWTSGGQASLVAMLLEYLDAAVGSRNLLPNQIATAGTATRSTAGFTVVGNGDVDFDDTTGPDSAVGSMRWTTGTGAGEQLSIGIDPNAAAFDATYGFPAAAAKTYTFSVYLKSSTAFTALLVCNFVGPVGGGAINTVSQSCSVTTAWQRFSVTGTAGAGTTWARCRLENTNNTNNVFVWVGKPQLTEGSTTQTWVPGQADQRAWRSYPGWDSVTAKTLAGDEVQEETVYDAWLPRGRARLYRVRAVNSITGTPVGSTNYAYGVAQVTSDGFAYLVDPYHPWLNVRIQAMSDLGLQTEEGVEVVRDLGDDRPVVAADRIYGEDATLTIMAQGVDNLAAVRAIAHEQHALVLRTAWTDRTWPIRIISRAEEPLPVDPATPASNFTLGYVEVEALS